MSCSVLVAIEYLKFILCSFMLLCSCEGLYFSFDCFSIFVYLYSCNAFVKERDVTEKFETPI
jgi:hypothetical protein